ncbi:subtilisin-like protease [Paraphaeosphaeria sporulosa]|uniref:Subtilisin-like protease n=1 Tax=Paraphaeosphaeria sporulosa TaxID=1460663 RepID=A0A177CE52_9PLEO|nr:subtilisin-like protease [Paraphaeosphaeria sporulosa]OAG05905.1 subtilisin-like protease [Paraphaeosphaeria sporulosa]
MYSFKTALVLGAVLPAVLAQFSAKINRIQNENTIAGSWVARIEENELLEGVLSTVLDLAGIEFKETYSVGGVKGFTFDGDDSILDILENLGAIKSVEPDFKMWASVPKDSTWGLGRISHRESGVEEYIYDSSAGEDTYIYVIDTGINTEHTDFGGRATIGKSFIASSDGEDDQGHGTHCSGTAAGTKFGVAKKANLIGVKVLGADGSGSNSGVLRGIEWAVNDATEKGHINRTVLSMSLGGPFSQTTNDAIQSAVEAGAFVAVAAGNEGEDASNSSPASAPQACTVGAINDRDAMASFSNFGELVDIFAPGEEITSAWIGGSTATNTISGTSMACPHIAGLAAYLIGLEGPRSPAELCERIQSLATKDAITNSVRGSPNLIAYNGNGA